MLGSQRLLNSAFAADALLFLHDDQGKEGTTVHEGADTKRDGAKQGEMKTILLRSPAPRLDQV